MFGSTSRQYLAAFSACITAFSTGCTFAWTAPVLAQLTSSDSPVPMSHEESSWVVAIVEIGNFLSPIPFGFLVDRIGRKWSLLLTGPITTISWLIAINTRSILGLYSMRILQGFAMSAIYLVIPMYLGEIAETKIRGTIGTLIQISCQLGILYTYLLGSELSYMQYNIASLVVPIVFIVTFIFMPESPYFYVIKNKDKKAIESLKWLRNKSTEEVFPELELIKENTKKSAKNKTNFREFMGKSNIKALSTILLLILFRTFTGMQTIIAYVNTIFDSTETFISSKSCANLFAFILLVSIFPSTYLIDRSGRRGLLIVSSMGCAITSLFVYLFYYVTIDLHYNIPYTDWIPFASLSLLGLFYNLGYGPLVSLLISEYFSPSVKAASSTIINLFATALGLISYQLFYRLQKHFGMSSNFLFSFICSTISTIYLYYCILETKGKTFNEIQRIFKYSNVVHSDVQMTDINKDRSELD